MECYTLQGLSKTTFGAKIKISSLKGSRFSWTSYVDSFIPIGSHIVIHLMMSIGLKLVFNHLLPPPHTHTLYLHTRTSCSFTSPRGQLIFFIAHTKVNIISNSWMLKKHMLIES